MQVVGRSGRLRRGWKVVEVLEVGILGPFELWTDGVSVPLGRRRERVLAAMLVLSANRVVSSDRLAESLWAPALPPPTAASALRVHVSRLRRIIGEAGQDDVLATRPGGYLLSVEAGAVDAARFESLVAQSRCAAAAGDHAGAAAGLRQALALWRGPALGDLARLPFATAEAARLEEGRVAALEDRIAADLACGEHRPLVGELEVLTSEHPLREQLWALRMQSLYRSGRQAEALGVYQDLRRQLVTELGLEPAPAVQALERAILRQDPALDPPDRGARCAAAPIAVGSSPVSLPTLLSRAGRIFVGREDELERLGRAWNEIAAGPEPRLALLGGEPGIGKTRLAAQLAASLPGTSLVLAGCCDEDLGVPYQPFVEALRHYLAHAGPTPQLGRYAGELVRLVPELADTVPGLVSLRADPETERYRLFDAVAAWLAAVSAERQVLLVLDDLHWATKPTLLMLRHLLRFGDPLRVLIVVTYRDTDIGQGQPFADWAADLRRVTGVERIPLTGLDQDAVAAFVEAAGQPGRSKDGDNGDPGEIAAFARAVWAETEGNPFFVAEVLRHLTECGAITRRGDRWVPTVGPSELGIPDGVREVIGRRLSRLSAATNRVLSVASVVGAEFEPGVVGRAGEVTDGGMFDALEEAAAARLLTENGGRYRFGHALVRATLYDAMSPPRRQALHANVAAAIETFHAGGLDDYLPALAHHWAQAGAVAAVHYAVRAGDRALAQLAHDEAAAFYGQALDLLGAVDDSRHLNLLISLGEAQRRAGDPAHRETLLAAAHLAQRRGDAAALARAALANTRGPYFSTPGVDAERVAALESALDAVPESETGVRARLLATLGVELHWDPDSRRRATISDEALALARRCGDPATLAHVLLARPVTIFFPATLRERLAATAELVPLAEGLGDRVLCSWAHCIRSRTLMELGDVSGADDHLDEFVRSAVALGQPVLRWAAGCSQVGRFTVAGRLAEAEEQALATLAIGQDSGQPDADQNFRAQMFVIRFHQGRLAEVAPRAEIAEHTGAMDPFPAVSAWFGVMHAELDRIEKARTSIMAAARTGFPIPVDQMWLVGMTWYASTVAAIGDTASAAALYDQMQPYGGQLAITGALMTGSVAHWLGLLAATLGRFGEADAHFASAATMHDRIGSPVWLARTHLEWAQSLLTRPSRDADQARGLLRRALTTAHQLDLTTITRRACALLG